METRQKYVYQQTSAPQLRYFLSFSVDDLRDNSVLLLFVLFCCFFFYYYFLLLSLHISSYTKDNKIYFFYTDQLHVFDSLRSLSHVYHTLTLLPIPTSNFPQHMSHYSCDVYSSLLISKDRKKTDYLLVVIWNEVFLFSVVIVIQ